ncbi:MAG: ABC transporter ATP-binding protein [Acidobacteriota bacterium]
MTQNSWTQDGSDGSAGPSGAPPVIELRDLEVRLGGRQILDRLSGSFSGKAIGLLGPNGAGKTTLVHTLLGFFSASGGSARILGQDVQQNSTAVRRLVGYMPERDSFIAGMTGVHFVRMMAELSGLPPREALEQAHEAMFYVGLGEARYRPVQSYSLGMKQKIKLAQALVHGPRLLFLDEPTNGLDPPARRRMLRLIRDLRAHPHMHLVFSSHLLRDVEDCCDEVLILKEGRIAAYCDLETERRSNRSFLNLETRGDDGRFLEAAAALGVECAPQTKRRLKMVLPEEVAVRDLYRLAAEHRVQLRRLSYKRDSLQDIFLKAMEGSLKPANPAGNNGQLSDSNQGASSHGGA